MNFGIIGAGMVAPHHINAIREIPGAVIKGITSRSGIRAEQLGAKYDIPVYKSWTELLDDADIDIVDIVTLPDSHPEISIAAAERGKHILLEKPMAVSVEEADRIIEAVNKHNVKLAINLEYRHSDGARELRKALDEGRLGTLLQGSAYVKWYRPPSYYEPAGKGTWKIEGGGALITQAIHTIDLLVWLMGPVKRLFGYLHLGFSHAIESEDNAAAVLEFKNGALGVIQGSTSLSPGSPEQLEICGEKGIVSIEAGSIKRWDVEGEEKHRDALLAAVKGTSGASDPMAIPVVNFRRSAQDLIDAVRADTKTLVSGEEARNTQAVIEAIYRSGMDHREIVFK